MRPILMYSQTWDDFNVIKNGLNLKKDKTVFSIAGAGDNILNLLLTNPKKIYAVDYNPAQIALVELKVKSFKFFDYNRYISLMGINEKDSLESYTLIEPYLSTNVKLFWKKNRWLIKRGLLSSGKTEKKLFIFRLTMRWVYGSKKIGKLLGYQDLKKQRRKFDEIFKLLTWNLARNLFLSKLFFRLCGLYHPKYGQVNFFLSKSFFGNIKNIFYYVPMKENYFLSQLFIGRYLSEKHMPPYLLNKNFDIIKSRINRIDIINKSLNTALKQLKPDSIDCFNFSDAPEWLNEKDYHKLFEETLRVGRPNSMVLILDCLVDTFVPNKFKKNFILNKKLSKKLLKNSMSPFYKNIKLYRLIK